MVVFYSYVKSFKKRNLMLKCLMHIIDLAMEWQNKSCLNIIRIKEVESAVILQVGACK